MSSRIYIKYMISLRCKMFVRDELRRLGLECTNIELGMADTVDEISEENLEILKGRLLLSGLEVMESPKAILIEKVKTLIIEMVHYEDEMPRVKYSEYISNKLRYDYTYVANIFSEVKGITIEQFIISHKIERVKELLIYGELNLTEISYKLNYSSVAHLSNQFKKVTGLTPTYFKKLRAKRSNRIEEV